MTTDRVYRTSSGTIDSIVKVARTDAELSAEILAEAGKKLDEIIVVLERKASKQARNRLRERFGLEPEQDASEGDDQ